MHSLCSTVDRTSQTACLSCQVKADVEVEEMLKNATRDSADGALSDIGEDCVPKLREEASTDTCETICLRIVSIECPPLSC